MLSPAGILAIRSRKPSDELPHKHNGRFHRLGLGKQSTEVGIS
jgi:hypothetical protein